jgi:hypothetical protein
MYLLLLAAILRLAACADGGMGPQQQVGTNNQPKAAMQPSGGGY